MYVCMSPFQILICSCKPPLIEGISRESKTLNFKMFPGQLGDAGSDQGLGMSTHRVELYDLVHLFSEAHPKNIIA